MIIGAQANLIHSSDFSAFELDIHPDLVREIPALKSDASQNRTTSQDLRENGSGEGAGFSPGDVSRRIFGPDAQGVESCQKALFQINEFDREQAVNDLCPSVFIRG